MNVKEIKAIVQQYRLGISPRRLGQHFLVDARALERIRSILEISPEDVVLEIGAGLGALTDLLLETGATIYSVEKDHRFLRVLTDRFKDKDKLQLVRSDILKVDLGAYAQGEPKSLVVFGNIPYSMTSPILEFLLRQRQWVKRAALTIQKEVADRIVAKPGTKAYSSLSLMVGVAFKPRVLFTIAPGAFYPQPKVTSSILKLDPLDKPVVPPDEEEGILKLIRRIFTHRRKTLQNALLTAGQGWQKEQILAALKEAQIDPVRRPETFTLEELATLHRALVRNS